MGRKARIAEAIVVPHDGVIYHSMTTNNLSGKGISQAQEILKRQDSSADTLTSKLWSSLGSAKLNQEQLQSLQSYRSSLLNLQQRDGNIDSFDDERIVGSYRLLLELSLSNKTNQPTRRAIRSCLSTLRALIATEQVKEIDQEVLSSIWNPNFWENSLQSMFEACHYEPLESLLTQDRADLNKAFGLLVENSNTIVSDIEDKSLYKIPSHPSKHSLTENFEAAIQRTIEVSSTLKMLLTILLHQKDKSLEPYAGLIKQLNSFIWKGITCQLMHPDGLSKLGISYGQTFFVEIRELQLEEQYERVVKVLTNTIEDKFLPPLNKLCILQGVATVLPDELLIYGSPTSLLEKPVSSYLLQECNHATEGTTRLFALRSLQTLLNRCSSIVEHCDPNSACYAYIDNLSKESLHMTMSAWENPPGRQVASAIPGLFSSLVALIETVYPGDNKAAPGIQRMVGRVLEQPVNRKGRYIALETLLPIVGAKTLLESNGDCLIKSLVNGVGDRAHTAGNVATLLGKILAKRKEEMYDEAGVKVNIAKRSSLQQESPACEASDIDQDKILESWIDLWAPHFVQGLLSKSQVRRKQVSGLCIPLIPKMTNGPNRGNEVSAVLFSLLSYIEKQYETSEELAILPAQSYDTESDNDIALWAKLEIVRKASALRLLSDKPTYSKIMEYIARILPETLVKYALTHSSSQVRLTSFEALDAVTTAWSVGKPKTDILKLEMTLWKYALPYAFKSTGKEYIASLLKQLVLFLNRLSSAEAEAYNANTLESDTLPRLEGFVKNFLIQNLVCQQAAYPGSVADKESFAIALLRSILTFLLEEDPATSKVSRKKRKDIELLSRQSLLKHLVSLEVLSMLLTMCHSMWDGTRTQAFECLTSLINIAHQKQFTLPSQFKDKSLMARGLFLSSSPRQREADTGALILCFIASLKSDVKEKEQFVSKILNILHERIKNMKSSLDFILGSGGEGKEITKEALDLPLTHGLVSFVRQFIDLNSKEEYSRNLFETITKICQQAVQICLAIVADVNHGEIPETIENTDLSQNGNVNIPLNVNTGAIGANATFSSINSKVDAEALRRFATQRIVMGSWLLTREACAALASAITYTSSNYSAIPDVMMNSGQLLLTTMTALKHQGAAYAAQKALQKIVHHCISGLNRAELQNMPTVWANRLLLEISTKGKVRDSTLRRSTGYALGFLSLMRPELAVKPCLPELCPFVLSRLLELSLPSSLQINKFSSLFGTPNDADNITSLISPFVRTTLRTANSDLSCGINARVHAFNILRLIILDAPLASQVGPFIGDFLVSAIIGYSDEAWAVRNSATMVFSAAMLRVVDSDKNANQKDKSCGNAITALEFFRQYSSLKNFFLLILQHLAPPDDINKKSTHHSDSPLILVLLLLARIQPVRKSGNETTILTDPFIPQVIQSLSHKDHKVRVIAARALANLASISDPSNETSYIDCILDICAEKVYSLELGWNTNHGALLAIMEIFKTCTPSSPSLQHVNVDTSLKHICQQRHNIPSSLLALAIEIKNYRFKKGINAISAKTDQENLVRLCLEIEKEAALNAVGAADLGCAIGKIATEILADLVWDVSLKAYSSRYSELLTTILSSSNYDVRLKATKSFKKKIYGHIDILLKHNNRSSCIEVLESVSSILFRVLMVELERTSSGMRDHPPTVRRLSRCLLECLYASRALECEILKKEVLWKLSKLMLRGRVLAEVDPDDTSNGNCLEIMAFSLCREEWQLTNNNAREDGNDFVDLARRLNDPLGPWRVRYSVARAIEVSGLLHSLHQNSFSNVSFQLHREVFKLLQDSDPDVRFVSTSSVANYQGKESSLSSSHLFALERAYFSIGSSSGSHSGCLSLSFLDRYRHVQKRIQPVLDELYMSICLDEDSMDSSILLNTGTTRKIFEDEEPNSYEEPLLALHLAVFTMLKFGINITYLSKEQIDRYSEDLAISGQYIVDILNEQRSNYTNGGILHDASRNSAVFIDMQGTILACTAMLYWGLGSSPSFLRIQKAASSLLLECKTTQATPIMHPDILKALEVLSTAERQNDETRNGMSRLCFLVPSNCNNV